MHGIGIWHTDRTGSGIGILELALALTLALALALAFALTSLDREWHALVTNSHGLGLNLNRLACVRCNRWLR